MVNARLCQMARQAYFFVSPRHFNSLDCETETSKCFTECKPKTFTLRLKFEPQNKVELAAAFSLYNLFPASLNWLELKI